MDAIIMAAGKGTRLMPLTADKPKAMIEVKGKPIISWLLDSLKECYIEKIFIITNYKEGTLKSYIKYNYSDMGIEFVHQKELTGTSDAIYLTKDLISKDFIVLSGDIIYETNDIKELMSKKNSLLFTEKDTRLYEYGTIDKGLPIGGSNFWEVDFINEKASRPTSMYINCGAYHFTEKVFSYIEKTFYDVRFKEKIITNTINLMIDDGISFYGYWIDNLNEISHPEDLKIVEDRL